MKPTDAEVAILRVLWDKGLATVRTVHEALGDKSVRYTTTLKQLQVMFEKGLVRRDDSDKSHIYEAAVSEEATQATLLDHLLENAFAGSRSQLFLRALSSKKANQKELAEIRKLLKDLEE
ncbi:MAG: BlaI/MecI/CopY family transcriptional regulator [Trueperaceae bacterium]